MRTRLKELCCYVGCNREEAIDLDDDYVGCNREDDDGFYRFAIIECEDQIYCTGDYSCPRHGRPTGEHDLLFDGSLCRKHFELFAGEDGDYYTNIVKADPELFDRTRSDFVEVEP